MEVTLDGGAAVGALAKGGEAAEAAGVGAGEAVGGEEIGAIEQESVERIAAVFEGGGGLSSRPDRLPAAYSF